MRVPPGGHLDRDELPHQTAEREVAEETGLAVDLVTVAGNLHTAAVESLPRPAAFLLEDIDVHDGHVSHQHIDFVFYGAVAGRAFEPAAGEAPAADWEWFTPAELRDPEAELEPDVRELGQRAIEAIDRR